MSQANSLSEIEQNFSRWCKNTLGLSNAKIDSELSGGNSNLTQLVKTDQRNLVMRSAPANTISPKAHLGVQREAMVMSELQGHALVPEVVAWNEDASIIGRPFSLIECVEGVSITNTLPNTYNGTSAVNALGEQSVRELARIARAPWDKLSNAKLGKPERFLERQIQRWLSIRRDTYVRELPEVEEIGSWLQKNVPVDSPPGVVHGDFHLDNTLCDPDKPELKAVIDWEMATVGDPLVDLGLFLMFWGPRKIQNPGFSHIQKISRRKGVVDRRTLVSLWSVESGVDIHHMDFYMAFAFWRLAAIVEGAYCLQFNGEINTEYAQGLEHDVPALLSEARLAMLGDW